VPLLKMIIIIMLLKKSAGLLYKKGMGFIKIDISKS
jgi:hypothetical protein